MHQDMVSNLGSLGTIFTPETQRCSRFVRFMAFVLLVIFFMSATSSILVTDHQWKHGWSREEISGVCERYVNIRDICFGKVNQKGSRSVAVTLSTTWHRHRAGENEY